MGDHVHDTTPYRRWINCQHDFMVALGLAANVEESYGESGEATAAVNLRDSAALDSDTGKSNDVRALWSPATSVRNSEGSGITAPVPTCLPNFPLLFLSRYVHSNGNPRSGGTSHQSKGSTLQWLFHEMVSLSFISGCPSCPLRWKPTLRRHLASKQRFRTLVVVPWNGECLVDRRQSKLFHGGLFLLCLPVPANKVHVEKMEIESVITPWNLNKHMVRDGPEYGVCFEYGSSSLMG
nr:hypothetical protein Itr_chr04CG15750 [Ipomoea trifida]